MLDTKNCAEMIKKLAKNKGLTINKVLTSCSLTKSLVYDMEHRNSMPSADKLAKIAEYLNVSVDYLLTGIEKAPSAKAKDAHEDTDMLLKKYKRLNSRGQGCVEGYIDSLLRDDKYTEIAEELVAGVQLNA
jgi:transcriptional regulator with XRE-family HTH domain